MDRKFPYFRDNAAFRMRMLPRPNFDGVIANFLIDRYQAKLMAKKPEELFALVNAEAELERKEVALYESQQWFAFGCDPDFDFWCKASSWTMEEAVALTLGKEPRRVTWENIRHDEKFSPFVKEFKLRLELSRRAEISGELPIGFSSFQFVLWAKNLELSYPPELEVVVTRASGNRPDWKAKYEEEAAAHAATKQQMYGHRTVISDAPLKPLNAKERESLLKMVIAMAVEKFGYDVDAAKSPTTDKIAGAVRKHGMTLDDDTIRKYLQEGRDLLPKD